MVKELTPDERLWQIFHPYADAYQSNARKLETRFVHYTRAEAAMGILKSKQVWMRKSMCMNDFTEVQHGLNCLYDTYGKRESGKRFQSVLDRLFPGLRPEIEKLFDDWTWSIRTDT
jgi:hypothetical protein